MLNLITIDMNAEGKVLANRVPSHVKIASCMLEGSRCRLVANASFIYSIEIAIVAVAPMRITPDS